MPPPLHMLESFHRKFAFGKEASKMHGKYFENRGGLKIRTRMNIFSFCLAEIDQESLPTDPREVATEKILQHILRQFVWIKSNCSRWLKWVYVCCNNYSILSLLFTYVLRREFKSEKYKQERQQKIILPSWVELNVPKLSDQGLHKRQSSLL